MDGEPIVRKRLSARLRLGVVTSEEIERVSVNGCLKLPVGPVDRPEARHTTQMVRLLVGDDQWFPDSGARTGAGGVPLRIAGHFVQRPVRRHEDRAEPCDLGRADDRL
jgi:hypothetical protein